MGGVTFKKGDRIIPRGSVYPIGVLVVDSHDSEGIRAFPMGGGFVVRIPVANTERFERVEESATGVFRVALFEIGDVDPDGHSPFAGYWDGARWNGWATPRFTRGVLQDIFLFLKGTHRAETHGTGYRLIPLEASGEDPGDVEVLKPDPPRPEAGLPEETFSFDGWTWFEFGDD